MLNIKTRQTYLKALGFKDQYGKELKIDGIWGKRCKYATRSFQKKYNLVVDGIYGAITDNKLIEVYEASIVVNDYMTDEDWKKVKYFKKSEFKCHCGGKYCDGYPHKISKRLVCNADKIRAHFGKPMHITSPLRCTKWNQIKQGVAVSKHTLGRAIDFYIPGFTGKELLKYVRSLPGHQYSYIITGNVIHYGVNL